MILPSFHKKIEKNKPLFQLFICNFISINTTYSKRFKIVICNICKIISVLITAINFAIPLKDALLSKIKINFDFIILSRT
jgi:hypothetical protein